MLLAVVGYPELTQTDFDRIQFIRARYDIANYKLIKPHFTFVFPCSGINRDEFLSHIRRITDSVNRFTFSIQRAIVNGYKSGKEWYLFLVPDIGNDDIINLHDKLYTGIMANNLRLDIPYVPHITVGVFENEQACKEHAEKINKSGLAIRGQILALDIISLKDNQVATIRRIELISRKS